MTKILCMVALVLSGCGLLNPACDAQKFDAAAFEFRQGVAQDIKDGKCAEHDELTECPAYQQRLLKFTQASYDAC